MANVFMIGDTHFDHANILTFTNWDGSKVRDFPDVEAMNETMVERWNEIVRPDDKVYHLGDVAMTKKGLLYLARLNGRKVLIRGNHDIYKLKDYAEYFYDIRGSHKIDNFVLSHIPVHPESLARWVRGNIHGHLHNNMVQMEATSSCGIGEYTELIPDDRYINVSVERTNYAPVPFEAILNQEFP